MSVSQHKTRKNTTPAPPEKGLMDIVEFPLLATPSEETSLELDHHHHHDTDRQTDVCLSTLEKRNGPNTSTGLFALLATTPTTHHPPPQSDRSCGPPTQNKW